MQIITINDLQVSLSDTSNRGFPFVLIKNGQHHQMLLASIIKFAVSFFLPLCSFEPTCFCLRTIGQNPFDDPMYTINIGNIGAYVKHFPLSK
jgi:hypothetical protein